MDEINRFSLTQNRWLASLVPTGPPSKCMASHAATSYGRFIIIHGGSALPFGTVNRRALYAYDTQNGEWFHLDKNIPDENALPRGLYGHTINIINDTVYIVGGTSGNLYFNSVYREGLKLEPFAAEIYELTLKSQYRKTQIPFIYGRPTSYDM